MAAVDPGLRALDWPDVQWPVDFFSQLSTDAKVLVSPFGLVILGLGAPDFVILGPIDLGRGALPPEFALVAIHPTPHMFAIKIITAGWTHFTICVHCFQRIHKHSAFGTKNTTVIDSFSSVFLFHYQIPSVIFREVPCIDVGDPEKSTRVGSNCSSTFITSMIPS